MSDDLRIKDHPVLGPAGEGKRVTIYYEGEPVSAMEGDTVAAALTAVGIRAFRTTEKTHEPRGVYCAMGRCSDCMMIVDGEPNVRTCVTPVRDGMQVRMQHGLS